MSLPRSIQGTTYDLVLKDSMRGYVELVKCEQATAKTTYDALIDWFKRYGVVHTWVSDQGSQFTSDLFERLHRVLGAQYHFVTAYLLWAHGSVEVVNRLILCCLKALTSEFKMQVKP
ncbi:hypothetical protein PC129_g11346 [Phytophthora cactorum]|uniref:Integrase catalytic domain-containing protein n=1 Tax=Phytophthora cactorum TaxID=29920 RepID=A0A329T4S1_9STRA|nr:hypothetical protein Pcac1_g11371 [Phytophthora cactorum]KAG2817259.1 hypothetical protein PC112_g13133 [Phytophthora cactorum]KAG2854219.1 hypothetical protein PC113_g13503 [Phytophthora cactorum]KAG2898660.1 hypothetical protein PC114_g14216 [Phytophthora cactorum]KAG2954981.1 hypothetical protein PC117_g770 [Phytophthora cactorum]